MSEVVMPHLYRPRPYQLPLWEYMQSNRPYKRGVCVWHRRAGKDFTGLNIMATQAMQRVGTYWHVFPYLKQGRDIAWQGKTKEGNAFLASFPREIIDGEPHNGDMKLKLKNGSVYQVKGADHPDRLVGAGPVGVIFSEWSLMDPQALKLINPMLNENGGWALFLYTPRGKNHGYSLLNEARRNPKWFSSVLTVDDTGVVPPELIEEDRRQGATEPLIQQEYYCSFETPLEGAFFERQCNMLMESGRIEDVPFEPDLPVHTGWDLGMDDEMVIWFAQVHNNQVRIPYIMVGSGEGLPFYANELHRLAQTHGFHYGRHFAPPDIRVRELNTGMSRLETARKLGIPFTPVGTGLKKEDMVEAARQMLVRCWFDKKNTSDGDRSGFEGLKAYRKSFNDKLQIFTPTPVHDWSSHIADAFQILSLGLSRHLRPNSQSGLPEELEGPDDLYDYDKKPQERYVRGDDLLAHRRRQTGAPLAHSGHPTQFPDSY